MKMNMIDNSEIIEKVKKRNLWALFFCYLLYGLGVGMFNVIYQPFVLDLTNSILVTGIIVTIGAFVQFIPMPFIGKLSDRIGRKKVILGGQLFFILGLLFLILANSSALAFLVIGIIFYFLGVAMGPFNISISVSENSDKSMGLMYGFMLFAFFGGTIFGSFFVLIGKAFDTRFFFQIFIYLLIIEMLIIIFVLSEKYSPKKSSKINTSNKDESSQSVLKKIMRNPKSKAVLIFLTIDLFIYNIGLSIYSAGLRDFYHFTREDLALISIVFNITNMIFQIPGGHLADRIGKKKSLIWSQYFGLAFFSINIVAFFIWAGGFEAFLFPALIISHIPFAMSVCTFIPSEQLSLTDLDETRKAESYGIAGFIRSIGLIPTGYIGGFLMANVHYLAPLIISFTLIFIEIWYLFKYFHE
jgi:MFS family permease